MIRSLSISLLLLVVGLLCGCSVPHFQVKRPQPDVTAIMPPMPSVNHVVTVNKMVSAPAPKPPLIPLAWPADWADYNWQIWGTGDLTRPFQLLVSNVDMTQATLDVPGFGACGFYRLIGSKP